MIFSSPTTMFFHPVQTHEFLAFKSEPLSGDNVIKSEPQLCGSSEREKLISTKHVALPQAFNFLPCNNIQASICNGIDKIASWDGAFRLRGYNILLVSKLIY